MKTFRRFLALAALLPSLGLSAQVCTGDFNWLMNGMSVNYYSTTSPNITSIGWSFGDNTYDFSNSGTVTHVYSTYGSYNACILYSDSISQCSDSTCHTIVIDSCYGSFTYTSSGYTFNFSGYGSSTSANTIYAWSFGDNTSATQQNPSHTYSAPGTYTVCFGYYDQVSGCSDSICQPVSVGGCNAGFTWIDSVGYVFFVNNSTPGPSGSYTWDFGDGNFSSQYNPSHVYGSPGTYQVCLSAYDSMQNLCDSSCYAVTVNPASAVNENAGAVSQLLVAPNPSDGNGVVSFQLSHPAQVQVQVYDVSGRMVSDLGTSYFNAGKQNLTVHTADFSSGVYFITINVDGIVANSRMYVSHE